MKPVPTKRLARPALCGVLFLLAPIAPASTQAQLPPCESHRTYQNHSFGSLDCHGNFTPDQKPAFSDTQTSVGAAGPATQIPDAEDAYSLWYDGYVKRIYEWQFYSGIALFMVVIALVAAALYFAYVQFRFSLRASAVESQTLQIDAHGLALKSSFLGVVILAFSLAFFFLYLRYVYPINETPAPQAATSAPKP
jgi:hypothetical protein